MKKALSSKDSYCEVNITRYFLKALGVKIETWCTQNFSDKTNRLDSSCFINLTLSYKYLLH